MTDFTGQTTESLSIKLLMHNTEKIGTIEVKVKGLEGKYEELKAMAERGESLIAELQENKAEKNKLIVLIKEHYWKGFAALVAGGLLLKTTEIWAKIRLIFG